MKNKVFLVKNRGDPYEPAYVIAIHATREGAINNENFKELWEHGERNEEDGTSVDIDLKSGKQSIRTRYQFPPSPYISEENLLP